MWCRMTVENFVRIVWTVSENHKKSFLVIFGLILAMFLTSQSYDFDALAYTGATLDVERLRHFKFSMEGQEKKNDRIA